MKIISYLMYAIFYETLTLGGTAYVTFVLDQSGWWWLLGVLLSAGIWKPERWSSLWDAAIAEKYRTTKDSAAD
ncbi:hypothetical protein NL154_05620 [Rhizobium sp. YTUHZ044]|uniref:hypothetical protein n=1 Tax=Rhizobium sp. YTUHZ044 TaxID=2962678 RepID=UPI003DA8F836